MKKLLSLIVMGIIMPVSLFAQNKLTSQEKKEGWILLFDGLNTNGWTTPDGGNVPAGWEVKKGSLTTIEDGKGGDIITENQYSDFDFMLDYKIEEGVNSGVKYFFTKYKEGGSLGLEFQIIDDELGEDTKIKDHLTGSFYDVLPPVESVKKVKSPGQWNTIRIVANGKDVEHWLNGIKILEFTRGSRTYKNAVEDSKFNKTLPPFGMVDQGHILLQEHGGVVSFRNIKIKTL